MPRKRKRKQRKKPLNPLPKPMPWVCPNCGPVEDTLHGADELLHCLECDAEVHANIEGAKKGRFNQLDWSKE